MNKLGELCGSHLFIKLYVLTLLSPVFQLNPFYVKKFLRCIFITCVMSTVLFLPVR
jgi:hypothetical protein